MRRFVLVFAVASVAGVAWAAPVRHRASPYVGALVVDAGTGRTLFSDGASRECYPASCTKLMTARLLLKALESGRLPPDAVFVQSKRSAAAEPSKIDLAVGETMSVKDALLSLMLKSANDISIAVAEKIGGSVENFVAMMNEEARALGMASTVYASPNGLPPARGEKRGFDRSTAADLAILARAILRDQPELLAYTSRASATVKGRGGKPLTVQNHNNLLWKAGLKTPGVDGLKTGYIDAGGSSIVLTGARGGRRAVVVVTGSQTAAERDANARRLMTGALEALSW